MLLKGEFKVGTIRSQGNTIGVKYISCHGNILNAGGLHDLLGAHTIFDLIPEDITKTDNLEVGRNQQLIFHGLVEVGNISITSHSLVNSGA